MPISELGVSYHPARMMQCQARSHEQLHWLQTRSRPSLQVLEPPPGERTHARIVPAYMAGAAETPTPPAIALRSDFHPRILILTGCSAAKIADPCQSGAPGAKSPLTPRPSQPPRLLVRSSGRDRGDPRVSCVQRPALLFYFDRPRCALASPSRFPAPTLSPPPYHSRHHLLASSRHHAPAPGDAVASDEHPPATVAQRWP